MACSYTAARWGPATRAATAAAAPSAAPAPAPPPAAAVCAGRSAACERRTRRGLRPPAAPAAAPACPPCRHARPGALATASSCASIPDPAAVNNSVAAEQCTASSGNQQDASWPQDFTSLTCSRGAAAQNGAGDSGGEAPSGRSTGRSPRGDLGGASRLYPLCKSQFSNGLATTETVSAC